MKKVMTQALVCALIFALASQNISAITSWLPSRPAFLGGKAAENVEPQDPSLDATTENVSPGWSKGRIAAGTALGVGVPTAGYGVYRAGGVRPALGALGEGAKSYGSRALTGAGQLGGWLTGSAAAQATAQTREALTENVMAKGAKAAEELVEFNQAQSLADAITGGLGGRVVSDMAQTVAAAEANEAAGALSDFNAAVQAAQTAQAAPGYLSRFGSYAGGKLGSLWSGITSPKETMGAAMDAVKQMSYGDMMKYAAIGLAATTATYAGYKGVQHMRKPAAPMALTEKDNLLILRDQASNLLYTAMLNKDNFDNRESISKNLLEGLDAMLKNAPTGSQPIKSLIAGANTIARNLPSIHAGVQGEFTKSMNEIIASVQMLVTTLNAVLDK